MLQADTLQRRKVEKHSDSRTGIRISWPCWEKETKQRQSVRWSQMIQKHHATCHPYHLACSIILMVMMQYRLVTIIITMYLSLAMQEKTVMFFFQNRTPERLPVVKEVVPIHAHTGFK